MSEQTAWSAAAQAQGTTLSERILAKLARKAFLSLWSYVNVYTDEGRASGKGAGKELCDLLIVFGNTVILFSDKEWTFQEDEDIKVAWPRWYKKAVEKSANQLAGAEKFLREHPTRIYLDSMCQTRLPIDLPAADKARYFLIAVTRGSHRVAERYFGGGSSGSFMLMTDIVGKAHYVRPFQIGYPLKSKRFLHVLDEMTVDAVLGELDTAADLVDYLEAKEDWIDQPGYISIPGEEDILARYMLTSVEGKRKLGKVKTKPRQLVWFLEGDWRTYYNGPEQVGRRIANKQSYLWDEIIEEHSALVRDGAAASSHWLCAPDPANTDHEMVLRAMAEEPRLMRRQLVELLLRAVTKTLAPGEVHTSAIVTGSPPSRAYVFIAAAQPQDVSYSEYREQRTDHMVAYAHGLKRGFPTLRDAVCMASEPVGSKLGSRDILHVNLSEALAPEMQELLDEMIAHLEILRPDTQLQLRRDAVPDFPVRHHIDVPEHIEVPDRYSMLDAAFNMLAPKPKESRKVRRARRRT